MTLLFRSLIFLIPFSLGFGSVYAGGESTTVDTTRLSGMFVVLSNILTIAVTLAGVVLVIMLAYGVWKSSMALGDPRGLEGAKQTWSYAIFGFFVVAGVFVIFNIIANIFGITSLNPMNFVRNLSSAVQELVNATGGGQ